MFRLTQSSRYSHLFISLERFLSRRSFNYRLVPTLKTATNFRLDEPRKCEKTHPSRRFCTIVSIDFAVSFYKLLHLS